MMIEELFWPSPAAIALFEGGAEVWQLDVYFEKPPEEEKLRAFLADQKLPVERLTIESVPDVDWVALVQSRLGPIHAGRFIIHGSHDRTKVPRSRWRIEIDAAQAFGTAHHGSTRGCLEALDALERRTHFERILDLGTGTGVLAIAAARLWNARVIASDVDPLAVRIAAGNAVRNGAGAKVKTLVASGLDHREIRVQAPFDLIIANILARPLIALAPRLAQMLLPYGRIVLSGITQDQAAKVAAAYRAAGFTRASAIRIDEWVTLTLVRG